MRGKPGHIQVGLFEAGSHRLVAIPACPVHHPAINEVVQVLVQSANDIGIEPYDESNHSGVLRAIQCAVEPQSGRVQLGLLIRASRLSQVSDLDPQLVVLLQRLKSACHSLFVGALPRPDNSLLATEWLHVCGPVWLEDEVGGATVYYPPDAFGQANPSLHAQVVDKIHSFVAKDASVVEYYAGVGTIGLGLRSSLRVVKFNEVGEGSLRGLSLALDKAGCGAPVLVGPAGVHADAYRADEVVIVDPPRKGLDRALLQRLIDVPPQKLIYLSCGLPALVREGGQLLETRRFAITHASAWAYFPYTEHIESLLVFERLD